MSTEDLSTIQQLSEHSQNVHELRVLGVAAWTFLLGLAPASLTHYPLAFCVRALFRISCQILTDKTSERLIRLLILLYVYYSLVSQIVVLSVLFSSHKHLVASMGLKFSPEEPRLTEDALHGVVLTLVSKVLVHIFLDHFCWALLALPTILLMGLVILQIDDFLTTFGPVLAVQLH